MTEAAAARAAARARTIPQVVIGEQDRLDRQFVQDGLPDYPDGPTGLAAAASTVSIVKGLGADLIVSLGVIDTTGKSRELAGRGLPRHEHHHRSRRRDRAGGHSVEGVD